jgi:hypothetical protein
MAEAARLEKLVDDLLLVLEQDIRLVEKVLHRLEQIRTYVIKRDESGLRALLGTIGSDRPLYAANESRRRRIREKLAEVLCCQPEAVNLSLVAGRAPASRQDAIAKTGTNLRALAEKLRKEHLSTTMLLAECARLNKLLLGGIFGSSVGEVTYTTLGSASWRTEGSVVSAKV